jgi:DNA-binding transcriptional regulator YhcF (GntR family)
MDFKESQPIFVQIAERLCDEILMGQYPADGRVPGVREYAALLEVNTNTAVKSYDLLARRGILYNKRGLGYFVTAEAVESIRSERRRDFFAATLPEVFRRMHQLGITPEEVKARWEAAAPSETP